MDLSDISKLPLEAKKLFVSVYDKTKDKNLATSAIKKLYKLSDSHWTTKKTVQIKTVVRKTGFFNPSYIIEVPISSTSIDSDGQKVSLDLLNKLHSTNKIDIDGDINHVKLDGMTDYNGLFKLIKHDMNGNELTGTLVLNKAHPLSNQFIKLGLLDKIVGVSAEFYGDLITDDNTIIDCDRLGWTVVLDNLSPSNADCFI